MKKKWIWALAFGLAASVIHIIYIQTLKANMSGGEDVLIVVAAKQIKIGEKINSDNIATRLIPSAYVDNRVIKGNRASEIIDMTILKEIGSGQTLQWTDFDLENNKKEHDLAQLVQSGQRAMAISVDLSLSLGGLLRPGHRVDILGTFSKGKNQRTDKITVTLLQNVTVLATGKDLSKENTKESNKRFSTVTLSVSLEESELLAFANSIGSLSLVLRGYQDLSVVNDVPEKSMEDIWEAERRNALQNTNRSKTTRIERIEAK